jgi:hypothetical protein
VCELGFVELLATRRALPWYINLKFEFAEQEVAQLHGDLGDLTTFCEISSLDDLLMPHELRLRFEYQLAEGVQDLASFDGGEAWLNGALDELNAFVDAHNTGPTAHISATRRLVWCRTLESMLKLALRSPPNQVYRAAHTLSPRPPACTTTTNHHRIALHSCRHRTRPRARGAVPPPPAAGRASSRARPPRPS